MNPAWDHDARTIDFGEGVVATLSDVDFEDLRSFVVWASSRMPATLVARLPRLALRVELEVRTIADDVAAEGYPWTANALRDRWRPAC